jgi:hypothetical protein
MRPSNTDVAHRVGPSSLSRKVGRSRSAVFSIERPTRSAAYTQLARQTLALYAVGVQPKMRRDVVGCRQPGAERSSRVYTAGKKLKSPMATYGGATRGQLRASARRVVKVLIPRKMETNPYGWLALGRSARGRGFGGQSTFIWLEEECIQNKYRSTI